MSGLMLIFAQTNQARATENWVAPVEKPELIHPYRQPESDYSAGHRGVDYLVARDQEVMATTSGEVAFVGTVVNRGVITLKHGANLRTTVEPVCPLVSAGEKVVTGQVIATVCMRAEYLSHCAPEICLHFSLRNEIGYLSPLVAIGGLSPSRLLPIRP